MTTQKWRNRQELEHEVILLHRQQVSRRGISRSLGISRNTVRKILNEHRRQRASPHDILEPKPARAPRSTKLDGHKQRVAQLLDEYPDITAQRIFEELCAVEYTGSYGPVKRYVSAVRPKSRPEPSLPTPQYGPGQMAESDWTPVTIDFTAAGRKRVEVFDYVLPWSSRKHFELYESSDLFALMAGHVQAFKRLSGAAAVCKYDSQKAVVLRWEGSQPIYNPRFLAFTTYYEFRPQACRRRHPNDKPRAERSFWEFERSFLNGRRFRDLDDMRQQLACWMSNTCDLRPHKRHKWIPIERFAEEQPHLKPLPLHPYDTARVAYRLCSIEGFIAWAGNEYAVPYDHITDILPVRITQHELLVYAPDLRLVARHELAERSGGHRLDPQEFHRRPPKKAAIDLDQLGDCFKQMAEAAEAFFIELCSVLGRNAGHHARHILLLRERYSTADLIKAFKHAQAYGAYDHHAIGRILASKATPRRLDEYIAAQIHERIGRLGPDTTSPRDLDEYDRLPVTTYFPSED